MRQFVCAGALALAILLPSAASAQAVNMTATLTGGEENPALLREHPHVNESRWGNQRPADAGQISTRQGARRTAHAVCRATVC